MKHSATPRRDAPGLGRRACLAAVAMLGLPGMARAAPVTLPGAQSLRDELALALRSGNPLVVLVSLDGCPFCKVAREHYLGPMRAQEDLPVVQIDMHSAATVRDFRGALLTHEQQVRAWKIALAPTVLFFGRDGAEVAPRLAGIGSPDYYGAKLDQRLEQARVAIKAS